MFSIPSFKEIVSMSKEKFDEAALPLRTRSAKARADMELIKYEEELINLELEIKTLCSSKEIDYAKIITKLDAYDVATRRKDQITHVVNSLFPQKVTNE
jgi:hypothetical protein